MAKKIGIDMRMAGEGYGIGKYISELVYALLDRKDAKFKFVLYFDKTTNRKYGEKFRASGAEKKFVGANYYSVKEQLFLPIEMAKDRLDLAHFPNFNVPIAYLGRFVVTIHDLIHHKYPGIKRKNAIYRLGYRTTISLAARRARKIIAVSQSVKADISKTLKISTDKIQTVYEGVSDSFFEPASSDDEVFLKTLGVEKPYVLWVGVWRRYKNLGLLAEAFARMRKQFKGSLVLAGSYDEHHPEVYERIIHTPGLIAPGRVSQDVLQALYRNAECYVQPSLDEGFGLTLVEAQASGVPVIVSDIPVSREVLGDSAVFFDPNSADDLKEKLSKMLDSKEFKAEYIAKGRQNAKKYSWKHTAEATAQIYLDALN